MLIIFCIIDADDAADCVIGAVHILRQPLESEIFFINSNFESQKMCVEVNLDVCFATEQAFLP